MWAMCGALCSTKPPFFQCSLPIPTLLLPPLLQLQLLGFSGGFCQIGHGLAGSFCHGMAVASRVTIGSADAVMPAAHADAWTPVRMASYEACVRPWLYSKPANALPASRTANHVCCIFPPPLAGAVLLPYLQVLAVLLRP